MLLTVDYLEFAVPALDLNDLLSFLGMSDISFEYGNRCFTNYNLSLYYAGVKIGYQGTKGYQCYVQMSGSGCRTFESLVNHINFDWFDFICSLSSISVDIRRLDIACDDYSNNLRIRRLAKCLDSKCIAGACRTFKYTLGSEEIFYCGSPKSNTIVRIYNKALERGYTDDDLGHPWIRCEIQLRRENAKQFISEWVSSGDLSSIFCGHVLDWVRFLTEPNDGSNSQRIPVCKWWLKFLNNANRLKFVSAPGLEYNLSRCAHYVDFQTLSSLKLYTLALGLDPDELYNKVVSDDVHLRTDQQVVLNHIRQILYTFGFRDASGYVRNVEEQPFTKEQLLSALLKFWHLDDPEQFIMDGVSK